MRSALEKGDTSSPPAAKVLLPSGLCLSVIIDSLWRLADQPATDFWPLITGRWPLPFGESAPVVFPAILHSDLLGRGVAGLRRAPVIRVCSQIDSVWALASGALHNDRTPP